MNSFPTAVLSFFCAGILAATLTDPAHAAMSKAQYTSALTAACMQDGRSSKLKLSNSERSFFADVLKPAVDGYYQGLSMAGGSHPSRSSIKNKTCSCIARYVAGRKPNPATSASTAMLFDGLQKCF